METAGVVSIQPTIPSITDRVESFFNLSKPEDEQAIGLYVLEGTICQYYLYVI